MRERERERGIFDVVHILLQAPNPGYMIVCSGYQPLVRKENVCEEEEYWATELNDIHDDEVLTNTDLDIPQQSEGAWKKIISEIFIRISLHGTSCCKVSPLYCRSTQRQVTSISYCPSKGWKLNRIPHS